LRINRTFRLNLYLFVHMFVTAPTKLSFAYTLLVDGKEYYFTLWSHHPVTPN
jgi:hypothetical protein